MPSDKYPFEHGQKVVQIGGVTKGRRGVVTQMSPGQVIVKWDGERKEDPMPMPTSMLKSIDRLSAICDRELARVGLAYSVADVKIGDRVVVKDSSGEWSGVIEDYLGGNQWWIKGDARDHAVRVDGSKIVRKL